MMSLLLESPPVPSRKCPPWLNDTAPPNGHDLPRQLSLDLAGVSVMWPLAGPAAEPAPAETPHADVTSRPPDPQAAVLRDGVVPTTMAAALNLGEAVTPINCRAFLDELLRDAGQPTDPIEKMLVEQLAVSHFRILELHAQAGQAQQPAATELYSAAAVRLAAEFRKTALAIRQYRG